MEPLLELQHQVLTITELEMLGHSRQRVRSLTAHQELVKLRKNAYVSASYWKSLKPQDRYRAAIVADAKNSTGKFAYSFESAASLWGLSLISTPSTVHVSGTSKNGTRRPGVTYHYSPIVDQESVGGYTVTSVFQTVSDCAKRWGLRQAIVLAESAVREGADAEQLRQYLNQATGRGAQKARKVAQMMSSRSESPGESITRLFLLQHGYPPVTQQLVISDGVKTYRPDFAWEQHKVILEFDGAIKYTEFGDRESVFGRQNEREAWLLARGWKVVRTSWDEVLHRPYSLKAKLDAALGL